MKQNIVYNQATAEPKFKVPWKFLVTQGATALDQMKHQIHSNKSKYLILVESMDLLFNLLKNRFFSL